MSDSVSRLRWLGVRMNVIAWMLAVVIMFGMRHQLRDRIIITSL